MENRSQKNSKLVWCPHPYKYLMVSPDNLVKPCCRYKAHPDKMGYSREASPLSLFKGKAFSDIRQMMEGGIDDEGCQKCSLEDAQGLKSMRRRVIESQQLSISSSVELEGMELGFSRVCNLKCRTCNSQFSTKWEADESQMGVVRDKYENLQFKWHEVNFEELKNLKTLKITGGEPFLSPDFVKFVNYLDDLQLTPNIEIEIFTNATVMPKPSIIEKLTRFKRLNLVMSIDGFREQNHYIRHPSDWQQIEDVARVWRFASIDQPNMELQCAVTISLYNIFSVFDVIRWCKENSTKIAYLIQIATEPLPISLYHIPQHTADRLAEEFEIRKNFLLEDIKLGEQEMEYLTWIKKALSPNPSRQKNLDLFFNYTHQLDKIRGESFKSTFPDLHHVITT